MHTTLLLIFLALAGLSASAARPDILISDFEGATYSGWFARGEAFRRPARDGQLRELEIENAHGRGVASSEINGDGPRGTLTSPTFTIQRAYVSFLIGGGQYERHTCLNLLVSNTVVRSATGWNSDHLAAQSWDVREFAGQAAQIQIVDEASGSWGHINVDHIVQTDAPAVPPANTQPLYRETFRPQFHFTSRQWTMNRLNPGMRQEGWLNDLNGLIYHSGEYHLFAQRWNKCWIHAVSTNLVHWTEFAPAFWETELDSGVQSGTCVVDFANVSGMARGTNNPALIAFWSHNDNRTHGITYSLDRGRTWTHYTNNPVLVHPERDPKVFWHEGTHRWIMLLYGEVNGERLYHVLSSTNLLWWHDEKHPIRNSYECPDFFRLPINEDTNCFKWVLVRGDGRYSLGEFDGAEFKEETEQFESDSGPHFYATQTWENAPRGRRVQVAWMRGGSYPDMPFNQQITFPRELTLRSTPKGPRLFRQPIREIESLYAGSDTWTNRTFKAGQSLALAPSGDCFRVQAEVSIEPGSTLTLHVRGSKVVFARDTMNCGSKSVALASPLTNFDILIDRTSIETFANSGEASMSKCYLATENGLSFRASGPLELRHVRLTRLKSAWQQVLK